MKRFGTKPHKLGTKAKKGNRKKTRRQKTKDSHKVRDNTYGTANYTSTSLLDIGKVNVSPIPQFLKKVFRWSSNFPLSCAGGAGNDTNTIFFSLSSLYDPDPNNVGTNKSVSYYSNYIGTGSNLYYYYRVKYVDVMVKVINTSSATYPMVCVGATQYGGADLPPTQYIHNIANRQFQLSKVLEYSGDTNWSVFKFRVYPHKVIGCKKRIYDDDTAYKYLYNATSATAPWVNITLGDSMQRPGSGDAMSIVGIIQMDYHVRLEQPLRTCNE